MHAEADAFQAAAEVDGPTVVHYHQRRGGHGFFIDVCSAA